MCSVMTRPSISTVINIIMMVEIAVLTSTRITALIALVTIKKTVLLGLLPLLFETVYVMTRPTMKTAIMMEETVVDTLLTLIFVLTVNAISMKLVLLVLIP